MRAVAILLALIAGAATWFVFGPRRIAPPAQPTAVYLKAKGDALFAASFKQFSSSVVPLAPFKGKPVVVYFWATWCDDCRDEAKALVALRDKYRASDLVVVGIGVDQSDKIKRFVRDNSVDFPVFVGGSEGIEVSRKMGNLRAEMPFVAAIDRAGLVTAAHLGKFQATTPETMATAALK